MMLEIHKANSEKSCPLSNMIISLIHNSEYDKAIPVNPSSITRHNI